MTRTNQTFVIGVLCILVALTAGRATAQSGDDRQLLRAEGANPNVLIIVDSSGSMARDVDDDEDVFIAGAEDPHAKMYQVKEALKRFFAANPTYNMGFTFYARTNLKLKHHHFLYRLAPTDDDGDPQDSFSISYERRLKPNGDVDEYYYDSYIDPPGRNNRYHGRYHTNLTFSTDKIIRFGDESSASNSSYGGNYNIYDSSYYRNRLNFRPLFGEIGTHSYANWSTHGDNGNYWSDRMDNGGTIMFDGVNYTGEYRSDFWLEEPKSDDGYYFPSYDWNSTVSTAIGDFQAIHDTNAPKVLNPATTSEDRALAWQTLVSARETLQGILDIDTNQIGLRRLTLRATLRECSGYIRESDGDCRSGSWTTIQDVTRIMETAEGLTPADLDSNDTTEGYYPARIVIRDYTPKSYSTDAWSLDSSCQPMEGFLDGSGNLHPEIPVPTDEDPSTIPFIESHLGIQPQMQFLFPNKSSTLDENYWPNYFEDKDSSPSFYERGVWLTDRTVMAEGSTPLAKNLESARDYFRDIVQQREDAYEACRNNFVILLTDGKETCSGDPEAKARLLGNINVPVYVIGYGMSTSGNKLDEIAQASGGPPPFLPDNITDLVEALRSIGADIDERIRAFASPIVPSVSITSQQHAYIASFHPQTDTAIWDGHLRAYLVDPYTGLPPAAGDGTVIVERALWDAGSRLALTSASARTIYFGQNATTQPGTRRLFTTGNSSLLQNAINPALTSPSDPYYGTTYNQVINFIRGVHDDKYENGRKLGDTFHSTPEVVGGPECFTCYLANLQDTDNDHSKSYRTFFEEHKFRRKVLFAGANDGLIHAFEAGLYVPLGDGEADLDNLGTYDNGTGDELFAWAPLGTMSNYDDMTALDLDEEFLGQKHRWSVDGSPTVADVFIDPSHNGTPTISEREWRTLVFTPLRRGGRSLTALDVTLPDTYDTDGVAETADQRAPKCEDGTATGCDGPWPTFKWEFNDDGLANTWSRPLIAFVDVVTDVDTGETDQRSVAIFGGGLDPNTSSRGKFLYMVDVETGKVLYKYATEGMVPGEVAALDLDLNGMLEVIYWGDTAGNLYRLDLSQAGTLSAVTVWDPLVGADVTEYRVASDGSSEWTPQKIATAGANRPIFQRPVLSIGGYGSDGLPYIAVAVGTGNRANVLDTANTTQQIFFALLDKRDYATKGTIDITGGTDLVPIPVDSSGAAPYTNYFSEKRGWYLILRETEKVNTSAVLLLEQVVFSTFFPSPEVIVDDGRCQRRGSARTYIVNFYSGAASPDYTESRYLDHGAGIAMATDPIVYLGADGRLHVLQQLDTTQVTQPVQPLWPPVRVTAWKER